MSFHTMIKCIKTTNVMIIRYTGHTNICNNWLSAIKFLKPSCNSTHIVQKSSKTSKWT